MFASLATTGKYLEKASGAVSFVEPVRELGLPVVAV